MTTDQLTEPSPYAVSVEVSTTLTDAPPELRGTTGYFRPEKARWTLSRGSTWARNTDERDRAWVRFFAGVEVSGTKTRARIGGVSGVFYRADEIPGWLQAQRPRAMGDVEAFLTAVPR